MTSQQMSIWICPACGRPVHDHRPFVAAVEGKEDMDFGPETNVHELVHVRFHADHFQPRIRGKVYILADE